MKKILLICLLISAFACKNESEIKDKPVPVIEKPNKELVIELNYISSADDEFKLSLNNIKTDDFQKKNIQILEKIIKTTKSDKVVANFGDNMSKNIIINLGTKQEKKVEIVFIKLSYGSNSLMIKPSDIKKYFRLSKYITFDAATNTLKTQKVDGRHVPLLFLKQNALNILNKSTK